MLCPNPRCGIPIQKIDGCNAVTCTSCRKQLTYQPPEQRRGAQQGQRDLQAMQTSLESFAAAQRLYLVRTLKHLYPRAA